MKSVIQEIPMRLLAFFVLLPSLLVGQPHEDEISSRIQKHIAAREKEIVNEYFDLLRIPNVSSDMQNIRKNAETLSRMTEKRGIRTLILETRGNPVVFGEYRAHDAHQTLLFYAHYDGQPADSSEWTLANPFDPIVQSGRGKPAVPQEIIEKSNRMDPEWRIVSRSAADDKAPIMAILSAIDALNEQQVPIRNNLLFFFEGEEELSSPNLKECIEANRHLLQADLLFICDGPVYYSGNPTLYFGVRGILTMEITVYGPKINLHSGHFGNWAPNPALRLARLLASMKNETGEVTIPGFYDSVIPLSEAEQKALGAVPPMDASLRALYGFSGSETEGLDLMNAIQRPSLNIHGIQSGRVGTEAGTIIPSQATVSIDIRLVKGNDPQEMAKKVIAHVQKEFTLVEESPDSSMRANHPRLARIRFEGYPAARTSMDLPISRHLIEYLRRYGIKDAVLLPTLGGSVPICLLEDALHIPFVGIPIVNHDNNQHQADENLRIGHLWQGIETMAALMTLPGK